MKYITQIIFLILSLSVEGNEFTMLTDFASLQWKNRIIVVNDAQNEEKALALFAKHIAEIKDRDIVWFIVKENLTLTNYPGDLSENFSSNTRETYGALRGKVILIGKDGGIKSQRDSLDLSAIFSEIDSMPMRQYEMKN